MALSTKFDVLSEVLSAFRLSAQVFKHDEYCGVWQVNTSGRRRATFHVLGSGSCWLHLGEKKPPLELRAGDVVVFPHDAWHILSNGQCLKGGQGVPVYDNGSTTMLCGYFDFGVDGPNPVLQALPEMILLRREEISETGELESLVRMIIREAGSGRSGHQAVVDKLCDVLFVMILRIYVATSPNRTGLLAALSEPRLQKVLSAIHQRPGHPWRLESLAAEAGMSRTLFANTFRERVGTTPLQYLAEWRMQVAAELLRDPHRSVAEIAGQVGYDTEAAFRRAYRRIKGEPPGAVRRGGVKQAVSSVLSSLFK